MANSRYQKRKNIAAKIAEKTHASTAKVIRDFHCYKTIIKNGRNKESFAEEFELDGEEMSWLLR